MKFSNCSTTARSNCKRRNAATEDAVLFFYSERVSRITSTVTIRRRSMFYVTQCSDRLHNRKQMHAIKSGYRLQP